MQLKSRVTALAAALTLAGLCSAAFAGEEISGQSTVSGKPMSKNLVTVTQDLLNKSPTDSNHWLHSNGKIGRASCRERV